ncbi:MAG: hypothetical protein RLZZ399_1843, partial [Verrucomicrobiota bacterium]
MKTRMLPLFFSFTVISTAAVYVDPMARPGGDGSPAAPFQTLEMARDAIRGIGGEVVLQPGIYLRKEPLLLGPEDSGTADHPVVWRSGKPGDAVLEGSTAVPLDRWEKPSDSERERLDPLARDKVWCLDLAALGVRNAKTYPDKFAGRGGLIELHASGVRQPLARWPDGFPQTSALMGEVLERGSIHRGMQKPGRFVCVEDRCKRWKTDRGVWLEGYWRAPWEPVIIRVAEINPTTRAVTFAAALPNGIGSKYAKPPALGAKDEPWWAVNLPEEITVPGEWAVDFRSQRLFWWPSDNAALETARISDTQGPMLQLNGVKNLRFEGLRVVRGLQHGVELKHCRGVEIRNVEVLDCGGSGVLVNGGTGNVVRACDLHGLGESG